MEQPKKYTLRPLPYAYNALEPFIDERTMRIHHDRHAGAYVDQLNKALESYPILFSYPLERLLYHVKYLPREIQTAVLNNGGGVYNHDFFFDSMTAASASEPQGSLVAELDNQFGGFSIFLERMKAAALSVFGSGWAWLVRQPKSGKLQIMTTPNQNTVLDKNVTPLLNLDVWEHAYYLKYQNRRSDYIHNWFHIVNWERAEARFLQSAKK